MTTIEAIKNECRAIIALGDKTTPGPWETAGVDEYHIDGYSYVKVRGTVLGAKWQIADVRFSHTPKEESEAQYIASFIASSHSFTPKAAKALLDLIGYVEEDLAYPPLNLRAREKLETIRSAWEESK